MVNTSHLDTTKNITHDTSLISNHLTVSIGLTLYQGDPQVNYSDILKRADEALYQAKAQGRNQYCMWKNNSFYQQKMSGS